MTRKRDPHTSARLRIDELTRHLGPTLARVIIVFCNVIVIQYIHILIKAIFAFKAKLWEISCYTHPKAPLYNIIIIVDTVQKQNCKHEI